MADISAIKILDGTTYTVRDYRYSQLPGSTSVFFRGDGTWTVPAGQSGGISITDGGDHLLIEKT